MNYYYLQTDQLNLCFTSTYFHYNGKHYKQLHGAAMGSPVSVVEAKIVSKISRNKPRPLISELYLFGYATLTAHSPLYTKTKSTFFTNTLTDRTRTYSLPRRSRKMVKYRF